MKPGEIRDLRQELGLAIEEFATRLRVKPTSVSAWEEGETAPNKLCREALQRLGRAATGESGEVLEHLVRAGTGESGDPLAAAQGETITAVQSEPLAAVQGETITAVQLDQFDRLGAATLDSPFSGAQIEAAAEALDRHLPFAEPEDDSQARWSFTVYRVAKFDDYFDAELLALVQHPFLEEVASRALRSDRVEFFTSAILKTYPQPGAEFDFWEHVDIRYHTADLEAVPRRMLCSLWIWLSDVEGGRGPLMYRPGSQRLIAAHMEAHPGPIDKSGVDQLPDLDYAPPVPLLARAGQVSVFTTATIHGASVNTGQSARRAMAVNFIPKGLEMRPTWSTARNLDGRDRYHRRLKALFRPDRLHIPHRCGL